jgi:hypothetical protein
LTSSRAPGNAPLELTGVAAIRHDWRLAGALSQRSLDDSAALDD